MNFNIFNENIGVDGYKKIIDKIIFPYPSKSIISEFIDLALLERFNKTPHMQFKITKFESQSKTFPKKSGFSRVRVIRQHEVERFINGNVNISDFYPPDPKNIVLCDGRYNDKKNRVMYLSDSPETAEIECNVQEGDYFLRSQFSLNIPMIFFSLSKKSNITKPFIELINSRDSRFYPVINYLMAHVMRFNNFHGCFYESIPANKLKKYNKSKTNLVIWEEYIDQVDMEFSFLCHRKDKKTNYLHLFYLNENKISGISNIEDPYGTYQKYIEIYNNLRRKTESIDTINNESLKQYNYPFKIISRS
ncbi:hypothetical protein [Pectobacterium carotovorum]|uniref:hypothetical protein n=1 Tax=Pectobacterium carotovorum TaxID=554 RepID=UPI001EFB6BF6|nr:hypothetical protein [Pectobacterium carotovorum]ULS51971.1 hypothetical protein GBN63_20350 [Pectobacterium carotovorum]